MLDILPPPKCHLGYFAISSLWRRCFGLGTMFVCLCFRRRRGLCDRLLLQGILRRLRPLADPTAQPLTSDLPSKLIHCPKTGKGRRWGTGRSVHIRIILIENTNLSTGKGILDISPLERLIRRRPRRHQPNMMRHKPHRNNTNHQTHQVQSPTQLRLQDNRPVQLRRRPQFDRLQHGSKSGNCLALQMTDVGYLGREDEVVEVRRVC